MEEPLKLTLPKFEGPLDLLLSLIQEHKLDIFDIPISFIIEKYLEYMDAAKGLNIDLAGEYLLMAATLAHIKSRMLLPREQTQDVAEGEVGPDPREELVRRLLEYQQMREIVDVLERRAEDRRRQFSRAYLPDQPEPPRAPLALSLSELLSAVDRVLRAVRDPHVHDVVARPLDVPAAIQIIRSLLALRARLQWTDVVRADAQPWQVLSALLGLLELARLGELRVNQPRPFANVEILRDSASEAA